VRGAAISRVEVERRVRELGDWFHNLDLNGVQTAPGHFLGDYPRVKWERFSHAIPQDLRGSSVLDIGCNAGFYSIEMKRRGADRVVAVDSDPRYLAQARLAAEITESDIVFRELSVYQLPVLEERFDIVLFMGVLYHLRYPLLALDILHQHAARDLLVFQSMLRGSAEVKPFARDYDFNETAQFDDPAYPRLYFIENRYAGDPTNWWVPNRACAEGMLRTSGFEIIDHPEDEVFICRRTANASENRLAEAGELSPWLKR
jgi:tRNA (mo5U34)-methyltransferase